MEYHRLAWDVYTQSFPPSPHFSAESMPDLSGKVVIVTGGNTGIGKETVRACLAKNARVYLACRSADKALVAISELKKLTGNPHVYFLELDLSDLRSVKKAAQQFMAQERHLHILFNNAGVMAPPIDQLTKDGYDLQFGTNVLGHFYFTKMLLPVLIATAQVSPDGKVRVVNTSSSTHMLAPKGVIRWDSLRPSEARTKMGAKLLYAQSKSGNLLFSRELAKRYGARGIVSTSLNPGNIRSELDRHLTSFEQKVLDVIDYDCKHGALTQLYAGTAPGTVDLNGKFLIPWARVASPRKDHLDDVLSTKLWNWLEDQVLNL